MAEWIEYTGSDEQIAELMKANKNAGFIALWKDGYESGVILNDWNGFDKDIERYWLIPVDPLREMKVRQAMTGQPVWWRFSDTSFEPGVRCTTSPDWNIPNAEYSFAPFED